MAYCKLDTVSVGRCSALMMQKIKTMLFLCSIKRKAIKTVVKWSRPKIRLATNASGRKYSQYLKYRFIKQSDTEFLKKKRKAIEPKYHLST